MNKNPTKIENLSSKIISYIFHPLLMPTIGLYFFFNSGTYLETINNEAKNFLYLIVGFSTCILPILSLPVFIYRRLIKNIEMDVRNERIIPAIFALLFYFLGYYLLKNIPMPNILLAYISSVVAIASLALLITIWWKISFHTLAIGGIIGALIALSLRLDADIQYYIMFSLILAGFVATARLRLNAHNYLQVVAGFVLGLSVVFSFVYFS